MRLGIDEAGRGPVIGPLVLCGVTATAEQEQRLLVLGIRDSKSFGSGTRGHERRQLLAEEIGKIAACVIVRVAEAAVVDRWVDEGRLNELERRLAEEIIGDSPRADQIVADGHRLFEPLKSNHPQLIAEDRAEGNHAVVAAASIVAKAKRDTLLAELLDPHQRDFAPIRGNGYCNGGTAAFLRAFVERHGMLPEGVRRSWAWGVLQELTGAIP